MRIEPPISWQALSRLREVGVAVPAELTVVGFDDLALERVAPAGLTTVTGSRSDFGRQAAETLEHHLTTVSDSFPAPPPRSGHDTVPRYLPMTLRPGATSGPPPS